MKLIIIPPMTLVLEETQKKTVQIKLDKVQNTMGKKVAANNLNEQIKKLDEVLEAITDLRDHLQRFIGKRLI